MKNHELNSSVIFLKDGGHGRVVIVHGAGGVGKSQLVLNFVEYLPLIIQSSTFEPVSTPHNKPNFGGLSLHSISFPSAVSPEVLAI